METNGLRNEGVHTPHDSGYAPNESMRIKELEEQVNLLTEKVMESTGRFADYENEIRRLNSLIPRGGSVGGTGDNTGEAEKQSPSGQSAPANKPGLSRFGSFMYSQGRRPSRDQNSHAPPSNAVQTGPSEREQELVAALASEREKRLAAEKQIVEGGMEMEELSATLFQQANEMVASERKENALLKQQIQAIQEKTENEYAVLRQEVAKAEVRRVQSVDGDVAMLGKHEKRENARLRKRVEVLERRDIERRKRLEMIEAATKRIEDARALLMPQ